MTHEELKQLISYDEATGLFMRIKKTSNRINMDKPTGWKDAYGYVEITLNGKRWKAHRLAWLYITGALPSGEIDHINRTKDDNRFCNLRDVGRLENELNKGIQRNNTSGYKGVSFQKQSGKWEAYICNQRKKKSLGVFCTPELAAQARAAHGITAQTNQPAGQGMEGGT